jgi:hypothetical protein
MHEDSKGVAGFARDGEGLPARAPRRNRGRLSSDNTRFGELTTEETLRSIELFSREVIPALRHEFAAVA